MSNRKIEKQFEEAEFLLPWYLTDTLSKEERENLDALLAEKTELQSQLVQEKALKALLHTHTNATELLALNSSHQRLDSLFARIDEQSENFQEQTQPSLIDVETSQVNSLPEQPQSQYIPSNTDNHTHAETERTHANTGLRAWLKGFFDRPFGVPWLTSANTAFALLLCCQLGFLAFYLQPSEAENMGFKTASVEDNTLSSSEYSDGQLSFFIKFSESTTYQKMSHFLNQSGIRIIDGPSSQNILTVWVKPDDAQPQTASVDYIIQSAGEYGVSLESVLPAGSSKADLEVLEN